MNKKEYLQLQDKLWDIMSIVGESNISVDFNDENSKLHEILHEQFIIELSGLDE